MVNKSASTFCCYDDHYQRQRDVQNALYHMLGGVPSAELSPQVNGSGVLIGEGGSDLRTPATMRPVRVSVAGCCGRLQCYYYDNHYY